VLLRHLGTVFGNPLPPGVTLVENKSKTLIGAGNEGLIVLKAAADAKPIENVPICVFGQCLRNFMVKMSYSSPVVRALGSKNTMTHFADRLIAAVRKKGSALCVGSTHAGTNLPQEIRVRHNPDSLDAVASAIEEFCLRVLDIVAPMVAVVKPRAPSSKVCGPRGMLALQRVNQTARDLNLVTILDSKRNDIASTAAAYPRPPLAAC